MKRLLMIAAVLAGTVVVPFTAFAHGTEESATGSVTNYWNYGLIAGIILFVIFVGLYFFRKTKKKSNRNNVFMWGSILSAVLVVFILVMANVNDGESSADDHHENVTFTHIHGLGYTSDGEELYVPAHDGLKVFKDGEWTDPNTTPHDYMGFSMFENGFYSSGHPAEGSDLKNPLGIVKSTDKGESIDILGLHGEIDFHGMTVGYETQEIYVFNPAANSQMPEPGFYYSTDEAKNWTKSELEDLKGQASSLTAHPTISGTVAVGTNEGVFVSADHGNTFKKMPVNGHVTAVAFGYQHNLLVATQSNEVNLYNVSLPTNELNKLSIPKSVETPIMYIQQNPAKPKELVIATDDKDIYFSHNSGQTWELSVDNGTAVEH
ncbi:F510_1955 family glycosylhydrolase [Virgibacillus kekensis]|uniref:F510_1955 family glycosylhydrolase n=1 Tax=Virgibacillus kekensis TaxID=202261 RepID=A0ABV9DNY9_9BACI